MIRVTARKTHSGPMPSAEMAEAYELLVPGSVNRIFAMAEKDQDAYIESHKDKRRRDDRFRLFALGAGLLALLAILAIVIVLVYLKEPWVAGCVAGIGIVGIVSAFINARVPEKEIESKGNAKNQSKS